MQAKIVEIGKDVGVVFPDEAVEILKIKIGDEVVFENDGDALVISSPAGKLYMLKDPTNSKAS